MGNFLQNAVSGLFESLGLIKHIQPTSTGSNPLTTPQSNISPIQKSNFNVAPAIGKSVEQQMLEQQISALRASAAATPKLPTLDTAAARSNANNKALGVVNPVYADKLNNQLQKYALLRTQATDNTNVDKTAADTSLINTNQDIATDMGRTAQDTQTAIDKSLYTEGQFQQTEGQQFDATNRADRGAIASAGLTESGLGQQQLEQSQIDRNRASTNQLKDFTDQRATQELFKTRTFEDLGVKGVRATELNTTSKANLDRSLTQFIDMQNLDIKETRLNNESDRQAALYGATNDIYATDVQTWLAGLKGAGWRPQDIALAAQVYS